MSTSNQRTRWMKRNDLFYRRTIAYGLELVVSRGGNGLWAAEVRTWPGGVTVHRINDAEYGKTKKATMKHATQFVCTMARDTLAALGATS